MLPNTFFSKFMLLFAILMIAVYLFLGFSLIFMKVFTYMPKEIRTILGAVFVLYGIFRLVKVYSSYKNSNN